MQAQANNPLSSSPSLNANLQDEFVETAAIVCEEFGANLKFEASHDEYKLEKSEQPDENTIEDEEQEQSEHEIEDEDDDDNDDDFSFACSGIDMSPVAAEDAFQDGQIRPIFPLFNQDLLLEYESELRKNQLPRRPPVKKVFVETRDSPLPQSSSSAAEAENYEIDAEAAGPYCAWTKKAVEASPEACKKSNSTGFSKLWRFRDLLNRSNSDGRDAYVFLNSSSTTTTTTTSRMSAKTEDKVEKSESSSTGRKAAGDVKVPSAGVKVKAKKGVKGQTAPLSAHEMHYKRNRASKEEDRHKSYLPYRPELVGFFTNVNGGMSRNVHPF